MSNHRRVLVTGASGGIGCEIARCLSRAGFTIGLHYHRNKQAAKALEAAIVQAGGTAYTLSFDMADRQQTKQVLEQDVDQHGAFWGIVLNAGIHADNSFPAMPEADWDQVVHTNLDSFYNVLHPLTMPLVRLRQGGRIVTIASVAGLLGNRGQTNYSAAKAGLIGATKALAVELASRQITVNCVVPGFIATAMSHEAPLEQILEQIPLRRAGKPEEVAALVGFLFREEAAYMTRQVLSVNGGLC